MQIGVNDGGYGEYDMSGGSLGANAIFVGGSAYNSPVFAVRGNGSVHQTGGSVGRIGAPRGENNAIGLTVGGNLYGLTPPLPVSRRYSRWDLYPRRRQPASASPLFVGGDEMVGVNGTGAFTQNCGTNAIVGGGGNNGRGTRGQPVHNAYGALVLGFSALARQ